MVVQVANQQGGGGGANAAANAVAAAAAAAAVAAAAGAAANGLPAAGPAVNAIQAAAFAPGPPAAMTWENLATAANLVPHEVGFALAETHKGVDWPEMLEAFRAVDLLPANENMTNRIRFYADSLVARFFLVVADGEIKVVYGWKAAHSLAVGRYADLMGERRMIAGMEVHPVLHKLGGNVATQATEFGLQDVAAMSLAGIHTAFAANAALDLVAAVAAPVPPALLVETLAWKVLPIHPKLACLFLRGMSVRAAFHLVTQIVTACPPALQSDLDPLTDFIRVAATEAAAGGVSALATTWQPVPGVMTETALTTWYFELVGQMAPRYLSPLPPPPMQNLMPPPPPPGTDQLAQVLGQLAGQNQRSDAKPYQPYERDLLFTLCGIEQPHDGLTDASLSPFWQEFARHRKKPTTFLEQ